MLQIFKDAETIGKEIGKMEEKKETAINMLNEGMTVAQVVKITKMTIEEVEKIQNELQS